MADDEQANTDDVLHKELARLHAENEQLRSHFHEADRSVHVGKMSLGK